MCTWIMNRVTKHLPRGHWHQQRNLGLNTCFSGDLGILDDNQEDADVKLNTAKLESKWEFQDPKMEVL